MVFSYKYARINITPLLCEYEAEGTMRQCGAGGVSAFVSAPVCNAMCMTSVFLPFFFFLSPFSPSFVLLSVVPVWLEKLHQWFQLNRYLLLPSFVCVCIYRLIGRYKHVIQLQIDLPAIF